MTKQTEVWVLAGPTASGKTGLSIGLAKRHGCEIVCMDSMQIYRGMDIGTAKPTAAEMQGVPHHLLDVVDPGEDFSVAQYQALAEKTIGEILARGAQPLLVGGTGFYLRALRDPMGMGGVPADEGIRAELQAVADAGETGKMQLHAELARIDPATAARLHPNDVRRVIRAIEVWRLTGLPFSQQEQPESDAPFRYRVAALTMPRDTLYRRVEQRVDEMLGAGLPQEVQRLLDGGVPPFCQAMKAIGYKELVPWARGETSLTEAAALIKLNTRHYAKRQLTWLRHDHDISWVESLAPDAPEQLDQLFTKEI